MMSTDSSHFKHSFFFRFKKSRFFFFSRSEVHRYITSHKFFVYNININHRKKRRSDLFVFLGLSLVFVKRLTLIRATESRNRILLLKSCNLFSITSSNHTNKIWLAAKIMSITLVETTNWKIKTENYQSIFDFYWIQFCFIEIIAWHLLAFCFRIFEPRRQIDARRRSGIKRIKLVLKTTK